MDYIGKIQNVIFNYSMKKCRIGDDWQPFSYNNKKQNDDLNCKNFLNKIKLQQKK